MSRATSMHRDGGRTYVTRQRGSGMKTEKGSPRLPSSGRHDGRDRGDVVIEDVSDASRLRALEALQKLVWGNDNGTVVPAHLLQLIANTGGIVLGAFCADQAVGFAFGLLAQHRGRLYHASHMLGVHPGFQGAGIGGALKRYQREAAVGRGLDMMTWTFDPLEARNAHFNLHKLGAVGRVYLEDHYGMMDDDLNRGLPSDRIHVEWRLDAAPRDGRSVPIPLTAHRIVRSGPDAPILDLPDTARGETMLIEAPENVQRLKRDTIAQAQAWRDAQRAAFRWAFDNGYMANDFVDGAFVLVPDDGCGL